MIAELRAAAGERSLPSSCGRGLPGGAEPFGVPTLAESWALHSRRHAQPTETPARGDSSSPRRPGRHVQPPGDLSTAMARTRRRGERRGLRQLVFNRCEPGRMPASARRARRRGRHHRTEGWRSRSRRATSARVEALLGNFAVCWNHAHASGRVDRYAKARGGLPEYDGPSGR